MRSINPPIPFDEFLEKNFNNLKSLIDNNQIIVIDADGNEVDSSEWKQYITEYYENDRERINLDVDSMFFEDDRDRINLDVDSMSFEHDDEDINLDNEEEEEEEEEDINMDEEDLFFEGDEEHDSEKAIQEELEMINKIDEEEKTKIAYKNRLIQFLEEYDEPSKILLEKNLKQANKKIEELQNERKKVLDRINQKINNGVDTSIASNDDEQYSLEEEIQEELKPISKINVEKKAKIETNNRIINSLGKYDGSYGKELEKKVEKKVEKKQYSYQKDEELQSEQEQVSSHINLKTNDKEEDTLERIKKIDAEEQAKIAHKNRLIKSLEQCNGLEKDIVEKGLKNINQKINELQSEREAILMRINQENQQLG